MSLTINTSCSNCRMLQYELDSARRDLDKMRANYKQALLEKKKVESKLDMLDKEVSELRERIIDSGY